MKEFYWQAPPSNWLKCNINGAALASRDGSSSFVAALAVINLGYSSNFVG